MNEEIYSEFFGIKNQEELHNLFLETLLETNFEHQFFVDWEKIKEKVQKYAIELNILNALIKNSHFKEALKIILVRYPEVLPCLPLLLAVREIRLRVANDFLAKKVRVIDYDFSVRKLSAEEVDQVVEFVSKSGLEDFLCNLASSSLTDYLSGVEVGLDSNARKNRSGRMMELLIEKMLERAINKIRIKRIIKQARFSDLKRENYFIPPELMKRKADFILIRENNKMINIETNFYNVSGSKPQEIVDAYINRQEELKKLKINFIWITDGPGWKSSKSQIKKALEKIDFVLNTHFVRAGLLEKILVNI